MLAVAIPIFAQWLYLLSISLSVFAFALFVLLQVRLVFNEGRRTVLHTPGALAIRRPSHSRTTCLRTDSRTSLGWNQFSTLCVQRPHDSCFCRTYLLGAFDSAMQPLPTATAAVTNQPAGSVIQARWILGRCCLIASGTVEVPCSQVISVIFSIGLILISGVALMAILVAVMTKSFEEHMRSPQSRWNIERARIIVMVSLQVFQCGVYRTGWLHLAVFERLANGESSAKCQQDLTSPTAHLQFESSLTAWERLSLSLNSRYAIWKQPGASVEESGKEKTPRTTLLGQPHWLLRQPTVGPAAESRRPLFYCQGRVRLINCVIRVTVAVFSGAEHGCDAIFYPLPRCMQSGLSESSRSLEAQAPLDVGYEPNNSAASRRRVGAASAAPDVGAPREAQTSPRPRLSAYRA